jgi:aminoglycoside/choline kinase family phosphotransferase
MSTQPLPDAKDRVAHYLKALGEAGRGARVVGLTGDASDRKYYRILPRDGDPYVLAVHASPIDAESLPFVNVGRLLEAMPVPTPRLLGYDNALGILSLQDLGDVTLQAHLGTQAFQAHAALYRQAVAHIVTMQTRGAALTSPAYLPYGIAFDVDKLTWELDFFLRHYLSAYRNEVLPAAEFEAVRDEFRIIVEELAGEPRVLCHRDYHSRNLMLSQGQLYLIDFQDARMGPDTYDLASLLRDSYVDLNDLAINELIAYFLALKGGGVNEAGFRARFDLMALQRNLKAMGTFGYQTTTRQNPVYIQYMPRTLRYVRDTLHRHPRFARLLELLVPYIDELR